MDSTHLTSSPQRAPPCQPGRSSSDSDSDMRPIRLLLLALALCVLPIVIGLDGILLILLPGGLPLGTLLAAVAFVLGAAVPVVASRPRSPLRWIGGITLGAALLWLPLGIVLSQSPALSFVNDASDSALFWGFTKGLGIVVVAMMLWAGGAALLSRRRRTAPTSST